MSESPAGAPSSLLGLSAAPLLPTGHVRFAGARPAPGLWWGAAGAAILAIAFFATHPNAAAAGIVLVFGVGGFGLVALLNRRCWVTFDGPMISCRVGAGQIHRFDARTVVRVADATGSYPLSLEVWHQARPDLAALKTRVPTGLFVEQGAPRMLVSVILAWAVGRPIPYQRRSVDTFIALP